MYFQKKSILSVFFLTWITLLLFSFSFFNPNEYLYRTQESNILNPQAVNRTGKEFTNISQVNKDCLIYKDNPSLSDQPSLYIPNYNISHAKMFFENITALNYTRSIENDFTEFILSSETGSKYIYQKFAVEINQYVNNVSILIQDINNPSSFTEDNSWEVAIVNCLNDTYGTPNPNQALGVLVKPHPISLAAHWELFNFKEAYMGPIFLNVSSTKKTTENSKEKYWFAIRIKIPADDSETGGGPKFLYFNPDDSDNIGEGATYAISPDFYYDAYTVNNVRTSQILNGTLLDGNLNSFRLVDNDRYQVTDTQNITVDIKFNLKELENSPYTFWELYNILRFSLITPDKFNWFFDHYKYIFSFDLYFMLNVSDVDEILSSQLYIYNFKAQGSNPKWIPLEMDINYQNETMIYYSIRNPIEKIQILTFMDNAPSGNNTLQFKIEYLGKGNNDINLSINQFKIEVGELDNLEPIQQHDPLIQELHYASNVELINGSSDIFGSQSIESLNFNDDDVYRAQASTSNLSFFVSFNVLEEFNRSLWDIDYYDWIASYPNPIVPSMDIRISSNVSRPDNLDVAALALYKGNKTFDILDETQNKAEWLLMSDLNEFAYENETTTVLRYDAGFTWLFLNILNETRNNEANLLLIYYTNESANHGFNVSINEFTINLYIQNAKTSDISCSLGLGINNNELTPSEIGLKNFNDEIIDIGSNNGFWEGDIDNAQFSQGFFEFNITSKWNSLKFDVNGTYELFKILPTLEFVKNPSSQYKTGTSFFSVSLTEAGGKPLQNFEVTFEILNSNNNPVLETTAVSNEEGIAKTTLNFEDTGKRFKIRVTLAEIGFYAETEITSGNIRVVDEFILFMDNFMKYLPYIIIGLVAVASIIGLRQYRHIKLRKFWASEAKILDDLVKISYIMIINKEAGVSIYSKQISLEGIDSDLISGFLQAISQFRREIKKGLEGDTEVKGFEMDYYDFKIVITDGDFVRVALILDGSPSEHLKENQVLFTEHFERRFMTYLKDFTGDITPFRDCDDLIENYFNISLVYPLQLGKHYAVVKLKGLEKALIEVAEEIQKEKKFFFISSLLNYGLAGRKTSRDEVISMILNLRRKGLIVPAQMS